MWYNRCTTREKSTARYPFDRTQTRRGNRPTALSRSAPQGCWLLKSRRARTVRPQALTAAHAPVTPLCGSALLLPVPRSSVSQLRGPAAVWVCAALWHAPAINGKTCCRQDAALPSLAPALTAVRTPCAGSAMPPGPCAWRASCGALPAGLLKGGRHAPPRSAQACRPSASAPGRRTRAWRASSRTAHRGRPPRRSASARGGCASTGAPCTASTSTDWCEPAAPTPPLWFAGELQAARSPRCSSLAAAHVKTSACTRMLDAETRGSLPGAPGRARAGGEGRLRRALRR